MACTFASDKAKLSYVQRAVRLGIAEADGDDPIVTQDTFLGPSGLGHLAPIRRKYYAAIRSRVQARGCDLGQLSIDDLADSKLVQVKDVTALVLKNLG